MDENSAKQAMAYFELMGRTGDDETLLPELESECHRLKLLFQHRRVYPPCFHQLQACFRTVLFQPTPPPFVIFQVHGQPTSGTSGFPIFTFKTSIPPAEIVNAWPHSCPCPRDCHDFLQLPRKEGQGHWFRVGTEPKKLRPCNIPGCDKVGADKMACSGCKRVFYCGVAHQKADWKANHKRACVP